MANVVSITGIKSVVRNLRKADNKLGQGFVRGAKLAGLMLQRESQDRVPIDYGILRASAYTRAEGSLFKTVVRVGYTANYALYIHELVDNSKGLFIPRREHNANSRTHNGRTFRRAGKPGNRGYYWDPYPRSGPKFLENPAKEMAPEMRKVIAANMHVTRSFLSSL